MDYIRYLTLIEHYELNQKVDKNKIIMLLFNYITLIELNLLLYYDLNYLLLFFNQYQDFMYLKDFFLNHHIYLYKDY